jgi:hypothetical protein
MAALSITFEMFVDLVTYYEITPAFLHFIQALGKRQQLHTRTTDTVGFGSTSDITATGLYLNIPIIKRSGRCIKLCYSFLAPELRDGEDSAQWPMRQCAVYHTFDLQYQTSVWIVVKANERVSERIRSTQAPGRPLIKTPISGALAVHSVITSWACEHWHSYISWLEQCSDVLPALSLSSPYGISEIDEQINKKTEGADGMVQPSTISHGNPKQPLQPSQTRMVRGIQIQVAGSCWHIPPPESLTEVLEKGPTYENLRELYRAEDAANTALLALRADSNTVESLRKEYANLRNEPATKFLQDCFAKGYADLERFDRLLQDQVLDLSIQQQRVEALLSHLGILKSYVSEHRIS